MKLFSKFSRDKAAEDRDTAARRALVSEATRRALTRYEKTFLDLARYDRGEPISSSVSHQGLQRIHGDLARWAAVNDEPIPEFGFANSADIDTLIAGPRQRFFGRDAYETIEEKAAFLFYSINKRQIFLNGNQRMSTLCLTVFLGMNGLALEVPSENLTAKALWLANTNSLDFPAVKDELARWIAEHVRPA